MEAEGRDRERRERRERGRERARGRENIYIHHSLTPINRIVHIQSNIPFLIVGAAGLLSLSASTSSFGVEGLSTATVQDEWERNAWSVFFIGISAVCFGSAYYHWNPTDSTLIWDRLPMTIGFMALTATTLDERVGGFRFLLPLFLSLGLLSIYIWHRTGDLRVYLVVSVYSLLVVLFLLLLFPPLYTHSSHPYLCMGWYVFAKVTEALDKPIFRWTGQTVSGHTIKHLAAAVGLYYLYVMLTQRQLLK